MDVQITDEYLCPITRQIFNNPYQTKYGHVFEKSAIQSWLSTKDFCPLTKQPLSNNADDIFPANQDFIKELREYINDNNLDEYVYKPTIIEKITAFIEEYNNVLMLDDEESNRYIRKFTSVLDNLKYHQTITGDIKVVEVVDNFNIVMAYYSILIKLLDFTRKNGRLRPHFYWINKCVLLIYNNIISMYKKLIDGYSMISLLVSKESLYEDVINIGVDINYKLVNNKSVEKFYMCVIKKICNINFNGLITKLYDYYNANNDLKRLKEIMNYLYNINVPVSVFINTIENEEVKKLLLSIEYTDMYI